MILGNIYRVDYLGSSIRLPFPPDFTSGSKPGCGFVVQTFVFKETIIVIPKESKLDCRDSFRMTMLGFYLERYFMQKEAVQKGQFLFMRPID